MKRSLTVFMLAMMNVGAICNIANLPYTAQHGFSSLFYYLIGTLVFFLPVGFISAELATGWPKKGGVYLWVREALGDKAGFVAIWLQWIENVIWYPTILAYIATTLSHIFNPALAENNLYVFAVVITVIWLITIINFWGMNISSWIITLCVIIGIFIPAFLIISFGVTWLISGNPSEITYNLKSFFPAFGSFNSYAILAGVMLIFGGLEVSAVHAKDVKNPQKDYPKAILLSTVLILFMLVAAALSIATIVPSSKIQLASGSIEMIRYFLDHFHLGYALPVIALLMFFGALGMVSTWLIGPSKGLLATAQHGELPPFLQKTNKKGVHVSILIFQALIVSALSSVFIFLPSVSSTYQLLFNLTAQLYLIMYILMFISGIVLRYKKPNVIRAYRIPFKNTGMWIAASLGIFGSSIAFFFSFIPTDNYSHPTFYVVFTVIGTILFTVVPLIVHKLRKPSWHINKKM